MFGSVSGSRYNSVGSLSVIVIPVALLGPLFLAVMVIVTYSPVVGFLLLTFSVI